MRTRSVRILTCILILLFLVSAAVAQKFTGTIRGTVTDPTGAVVSGATVNVVDQNTGLKRTMKAGQTGDFDFQGLPIGTYRIEGKADGFKEIVQTGLALHVNDIAVINLKLQVGSTNETVSVEASPVAVETQSGSVSSLVQAEQVRELPLNGRNFVQLTQLVPGVAAGEMFNSTNKGLQGNVGMSISGGRSTGNQWLVDGANNNDVGSNQTILTYPSIDTIEEFKIQRNSYGPEFGQTAGGTVNIVTRGGTNQFHGTAYYFGRNDALNSRDWFIAHAGQDTQKLRRNDFGFSFGGPIKKDKLFFFWSEEWNREIRGYARSGLVPTLGERSGDFSGNQFGYISDGTHVTFDPVTGAQTGGIVTPDLGWTGARNYFTTFASVGLTPNPAALTYMKIFPLPNVAPTANNPAPNPNWIGSMNTPVFFREDSIRGDYHISSRNSLMVRYTREVWDNQKYNVASWGDDPYPAIDTAWKQPSKMLVGKLTSTLGNTAVNDFQVSWSGNSIDTTLAGDNPGLNREITQTIRSFYPESVKLAGQNISMPLFWSAGGYTPSGLYTLAPYKNNMDLVNFKDDFSKVAGKHTMKFGFLYATNRKNEYSDGGSGEAIQFWGMAGQLMNTPDWANYYPGCPEGAQNCMPSWTKTGNWIADLMFPQMMMGFDEFNHINIGKVRWHDIEFYAGDNWRVTPKLTLEYGIRWSFLREPFTADNIMSSFDPSAYSPAYGDSSCNGLYFPKGTNPCTALGLAGGMEFGNRSLKENSNHAIAPRIGFAFDPFGNGKTSIRAGVGQFFQRERVGYVLSLLSNPPFSARTSGYRSLEQVPDANNPFPGAIAAPVYGSPRIGIDPRALMPNNWQWNLTFEQELFKNTKLEIGYVGSRGIHLANGIDLNQIAPKDRLEYIYAAQTPNAADAAQSKFRPYSFVGDKSIFWFGRTGDSIYHSLQTMFSGKVGKNLMWQGAYTWSKLISSDPLTDSGSPAWSGGVVTDNSNPGFDRGLSELNRPHVFAFNVVYHLPAFAGRSPFVKHAFGDWEISNITSAMSGHSITVYSYNDDFIGTGNSNNARPDVVPGVSCYANDANDPLQYLNPNAFTVVGHKLGTIGNEPRGYCSGPKTFRSDLALYKNVKLSERMKLQFRLEMFNFINHANFVQPALGYSLNEITYNNGHTTVTKQGDPLTDRATTITGQKLATGFGRFNRTDGQPREIQYAIKLIF